MKNRLRYKLSDALFWLSGVFYGWGVRVMYPKAEQLVLTKYTVKDLVGGIEIMRGGSFDHAWMDDHTVDLQPWLDHARKGVK